MAVIVWQLDLHLPMQLVGVRILLRRDVLDTTLCDQVCH